VSAIGQSNAADQQKKAYDDWAAQQHANRVAAAAKDEQDRQQASAAQQQGLQDVGADSQKTAQQQEQDRLGSYLQGQSPSSTESNPSPATAVSDARLSGQQGGDATFQSDLSSKLDQAKADSKKRIAALAAVGSYGGSFGGLDNTVSQAFQKSGGGIDMANDFRKGDLAVYNTQQAVSPLQYTYSPGPLPALSGAALQSGAQGLGQGLGKMLAGGVK
jgi:hypothetical protein